MRTFVAFVLIVGACQVPSANSAQICSPSDTPTTCRVKVVTALPSEENDEIKTDVGAAVTTANTGSVESPANPTSVVTDFNPLLQMAADSGGLGNDDETLTFSLNHFVGVPAKDYQAKLVLRHAELNKSLASSLRANGATGEARVTELEGEFGDFDDPTLTVSYSPKGKSKGRNPGDHVTLLSDAFRTARKQIPTTSAAGTAALVAAFTAETNLATSIENDWRPPDPNLDLEKTSFASMDEKLPGRGMALMAAVERTERIRNARLDAMRTVLRQSEFFTFVDLIDNQPQLFVSMQVGAPDELVGPRTVSAKLTWEKGFVNMNRFEESRTRCKSPTLLDCLSAYLNEGTNRADLESGHRISVSIEYKKIDSYQVALVDDGVSVDTPKDESLVGSFAYGRYLPANGLGTGKPRLDIAMNYEKVDNETLRQNRFVTTLTVSQKLSNASILSFGIVYANKPEFRGDVDKEVSARLGLNYKIGEPK